MPEPSETQRYMRLIIDRISLRKHSADRVAAISCTLWNESGHPVLLVEADCSILPDTHCEVSRSETNLAAQDRTRDHIAFGPDKVEACSRKPLSFNLRFSVVQNWSRLQDDELALELRISARWRYEGEENDAEEMAYCFLKNSDIFGVGNRPAEGKNEVKSYADLLHLKDTHPDRVKGDDDA